MQAVSSLIRKVVVCTALAGIATVALPLATAQQNNATRGGLGGVVMDPTGAAVAGAKVTITGPQQTVTVTTGTNGRFEANGLIPGLYTVSVVAPGFSKYVSSSNEVTIDHTNTLDATLSVGNVDTTVSVEGGTIAIDTENTSVNSAITDTLYEQMPLPRNVSGAFYTAPGVVSGGGTGTANPSIGGSSGLENLYTADGVTITDQAYGGLGVYTPSHGSLGTGINLAFVKEVDIKTEAFEPKYGQGDGGIVEIVTKSGSNAYHGSIATYITPQYSFASPRAPYQYNWVVTTPSTLLAQPQYEVAAEIGGYVPGLREKLFFFGAFDPTLNRQVVAANPNSGLSNQVFNYNTTSANWAAKLTFTPFNSTIIEASTYGDPSRNNSAPSTTSAVNAKSVSSNYNFGTRNSVARVNTVVFPWLTAFGAYSYNHAHFTEIPTLINEAGYQDRRSQPYTFWGLGTYYATKDNNWQLQGELQANGKFLGKHTASIGYLYDHLDFGNSTLRSGPGFTIPSNNAAGLSLATLYNGYGASAYGKHSNAFYRLFTTTGCTYCTTYQNKQVYFQAYRATYNGSVVSAVGRYHAAYGNEVYAPNRYLTLNAGLRWEQQAYGGSLLTYHWRDNWSPRVGVTVDPFGNRKSKVFFTFSRYQAPLPLDAAVRQLGSEQDDTAFYFRAQADANGNAVPDATGALVPDTSVALNGTPKTATAAFGRPSFSSSTGEGILPGTKMEFTDEYVLGLQREVGHGMLLEARYADRHFVRIVEDIGSQSPEGSNVDGDFAGGIANVTGSTDLFLNENEVNYTPAQFAAANGGKTPGQVTAATYVAPVPGCTYANDTAVANGAFFSHFDGTSYPGSCVTNAAVAGGNGADGKPDGFADPRRHYQALELALNRQLKNHWQARINYRFAKLFGNYEGFYRNDNGQSDPGISSLFDFTQGSIGLLGDQFKRGYLNTDRRHVFNGLFAYTFDKSNHMRVLNGLTAGTYFHVLTGAPISALASHPIYLNQGEVPIGGRGTFGRFPTAAQLDLHLEDAYKLGDKYTFRAAFDAFNVFDSQPVTNQNQFLDTAPLTAGGVLNADYGKPSAFQQPFRARFKVAFEF